MATPTAMMAAIGNATKRGILIKSGAAVEAVARIDTLVMDKTGTLTYGKLQVEEIEIIDRDRASFVSLVASAEKFSEHPLGKAVLAYAQSRGICAKDPQTFEMQTGKGIIATVDGQKILIGEKTIGQELLLKTPQALTFIEQMQKEGKTVLPVASDGKIIGILSIADVLRKEVRSTIAELKKTGLTRIVMLTGDHQAVANSIGQAAGMTDIFASQLPEDKVNSITNLADQGHSVGMVGDGVNDAPALAQADVGVAMGEGTDLSITSAQVVLLGERLGLLLSAVTLATETRRVIRQNLILSGIYNVLTIPLAVAGLVTPLVAAIVMPLSSLAVIGNSLRLTRKEA
jgi:heavy metal translocating P-type ATPase